MENLTNNNFTLEWLDGNTASPLHFTCGIIAGILASLVTQPADVIKTKMQLYPGEFSSVKSVIIYLQKRDGVSGYFKGLVPRMLRRTLMSDNYNYRLISNRFFSNLN
ncbi:mitochondrial carrier protein, putative [Pediculus humanus corporis]|uniref:Mitochondrial carrier protein, putative n=1 Tax=Pediculus humanus subsp. corporis TaxID=121224 RepID=E0W2F1_PEDHC|nr:mitochondrial carrier protein, putative [Pediculus humanus corporis]EEB19807.1 mitochondrial carrier protein, putative [Pediculus humanus corporis]